MKTVGIITLSNSTNYGGILQSVALSRTISSLGMKPINITYQKMPGAWKSVRHYVSQRVCLYGSKGIYTKIRICGGVVKTLVSNIHYLDARKKRKNFILFINSYLQATPYYATEELLRKNCSAYDAYITGSDQVWNTSFSYNEFLPPFFLSFVPDGVPCYSYAASVGGKKSDDYVKEIIRRTKHFVGITVREKSLEEQMHFFGCNRVETMLDPTLLLRKEEWETLENKPDAKIPEHYILVYYLEKDSNHDLMIKKVTEEMGLPVVNIMPTYKKADYPCIEDRTAGPAEFLYYVHHADYIITNSFHMVVFSMLYNKKFIALAREGQESRIIDLLKKVHLEDRYVKRLEDCKVITKEYSDISGLIKEDREKSLNFLKSIGEYIR